ncbi:MAG: sigma 54-interacting transcriptional regulator [Pirellulaceae bacterium]
MELDFRKSPQVLADIVDAMGAGVFTVDARGRFVAWNEGAERITGYRADEVIGRPCTLLEGPNCKGFGKLAELLDADQPPVGICGQECKVQSKDGRELYIHGNVRLVYDQHGAVAGAVGTFLDMTSFVEAHEKIALLEQQVYGGGLGEMIGKSEAMQEVFRRIQLAADSDVTVLITGESGTGKELAARAVHTQSERRGAPFLAINCSAIPEALLESELFGHAKGSFTGAHADKQGLFEAAGGGTLFLDEIGEVSTAIQVKLLRVLQEREVRRVGESRTRKVDVRLVTATNKNLKQLVAEGKIREDFFYRIHVFAIHMPPLRQRREDIPLLTDHFLNELCRSKGRAVDGVARDALKLLLDYEWPGNVRQLRNAIEHACVTVSGDRISYLDLPPEIRDPHGSHLPDVAGDLDQEERAERDRIIGALRQTGGNRTKAAELLGVSRVTLWKKIGKYAIEVPT